MLARGLVYPFNFLGSLEKDVEREQAPQQGAGSGVPIRRKHAASARSQKGYKGACLPRIGAGDPLETR